MKKAIAKLVPANNVRGVVYFEESNEPNKLKISYEIYGLSDGKHGFRVHQYGDLTEGCKSACSHFNPLHTVHGGRHSKIRHAGDLGNITSKNGIAEGSMTAHDLALRGERFNILGRMIIVHEDEDDLGKGTGAKREESLKTGNAGKRLSCGVIGLCAR